MRRYIFISEKEKGRSELKMDGFTSFVKEITNTTEDI